MAHNNKLNIILEVPTMQCAILATTRVEVVLMRTTKTCFYQTHAAMSRLKQNQTQPENNES